MAAAKKATLLLKFLLEYGASAKVLEKNIQLNICLFIFSNNAPYSLFFKLISFPQKKNVNSKKKKILLY